jgi:hypothetical protein
MSSALTQPLDLSNLADIAAGLARSVPSSVTPDGQSGFEGIEREDRDLRRFARLLQTPAYEVWLIAWEAAADLELHDHGGSQGAFHVVDGALVESHSDLGEPVYYPPLRSMTFYDDQPDNFLTPLRTDLVDGAPEPGGSR